MHWGGVATFTEAPEIPQDYSEDEGIDVVMLDGFDMFEYSSGQLSDEIEFIDAPPEEEQQAIIDAWADSLNSGLEDLEWVEGDAEVIFYGSLLVDVVLGGTHRKLLAQFINAQTSWISRDHLEHHPLTHDRIL
jgi:hypothetical protein